MDRGASPPGSPSGAPPTTGGGQDVMQFADVLPAAESVVHDIRPRALNRFSQYMHPACMDHTHEDAQNSPESQPPSVGTHPVRERTFTWQDPVATMLSAAQLHGREALEAMARGEIASPPIAYMLGMDTFDVHEDGSVSTSLIPQEFHYNPIGMVHGGVITTLLDTAAGCAVQATLPAGVGYASLDLVTRFIRPVRVDTGRITATGRVVHRGNRTVVAEATLVDERGRLLASASSTCMIMGGKQA